jgi:hypothetical protein
VCVPILAAAEKQHAALDPEQVGLLRICALAGAGMVLASRAPEEHLDSLGLRVMGS